MPENKSYLIWAIIAVIIVAALGIWYWSQRPEPKSVESPQEAIEALNAPAVTEVPTNPIQGKVPELNPVDKVNPFNNVYQNPFE